MGNTANPSTLPNAARSQWQYCHDAPEASRPRSLRGIFPVRSLTPRGGHGSIAHSAPEDLLPAITTGIPIPKFPDDPGSEEHADRHPATNWR